jgi:hypothetical protein
LKFRLKSDLKRRLDFSLYFLFRFIDGIYLLVLGPDL